MKLPWARRCTDARDPHADDRSLDLHRADPGGIAGRGRGFGGRVMFYNDKDEKPVAVDGAFTVFGFDETGGDVSFSSPDKKFLFPVEKLSKHYSKSELGHSYSFWLPWDEVGGPERKICLIARFQPKDGPLVISKPCPPDPCRRTAENGWAGKAAEQRGRRGGRRDIRRRATGVSPNSRWTRTGASRRRCSRSTCRRVLCGPGFLRRTRRERLPRRRFPSGPRDGGHCRLTWIRGTSPAAGGGAEFDGRLTCRSFRTAEIPGSKRAICSTKARSDSQATDPRPLPSALPPTPRPTLRAESRGRP